ncbi:hypothetical protein J1792_13285 [Streptomyces triculaminicus]|uniref:Phosphatidic acid phosphatase type 2/haloperoxidase domain-containing protein n=1 Tax=Streptomyces triculaminicus TaxID=2816232 RepID=A0A939FM13_9ACTN|nr:hypothetical protein [Streptomyces triculaminicus]MBO0653717.1 hypothetical protein [Streptomyces triculaminicus]
MTAEPAAQANGIFDGAGIDGPTYLGVVHSAQQAPAWINRLIDDYSAYGLALFAILMLLGWWQARNRHPEQAAQALAMPVITVGAFAISSLLKLLVREARPCQSLHVITLEACPAPGDWSFPSNHATLRCRRRPSRSGPCGAVRDGAGVRGRAWRRLRPSAWRPVGRRW